MSDTESLQTGQHLIHEALQQPIDDVALHDSRTMALLTMYAGIVRDMPPETDGPKSMVSVLQQTVGDVLYRGLDTLESGHTSPARLQAEARTLYGYQVGRIIGDATAELTDDEAICHIATQIVTSEAHARAGVHQSLFPYENGHPVSLVAIVDNGLHNPGEVAAALLEEVRTGSYREPLTVNQQACIAAQRLVNEQLVDEKLRLRELFVSDQLGSGDVAGQGEAERKFSHFLTKLLGKLGIIG